MPSFPPLPAPPPRRGLAAVLVLGGANVDLSGHSSVLVRAGDSNPGQLRWAPGGVARNIAARLVALDPARPVRLVSAVGRDAAGRALLQATRADGVDVGGCQRFAGAATATYLSLHQPDGELLAAVNDMAVLQGLTPARLARETAALRAAAAVVVDANLSDEALAWLCAQDLAAPLFADPVSAAKCERLQPALARVHTLKPNALEAAQLSGRLVRTPAQAERAAAWFHAQGVQQLALSLGAQGLWLSRRGRGGTLRGCWQPAPKVAVRSVTGAGDAMMAALVHATLAGWPLRRTARYATACAARALQALTA